jgi:hypothetical protein
VKKLIIILKMALKNPFSHPQDSCYTLAGITCCAAVGQYVRLSISVLMPDQS